MNDETSTRAGIAHMCFVHTETGDEIHGHFVELPSKECFGISATECTEDERPHDCCYSAEDPTQWFHFSVVDYKQNLEFTDLVKRRGGDYAVLTSPHISFSTEALKTDDEAREHIRKFSLPSKHLNADAIVCIGRCTLKEARFTTPAEQRRRE